MSAKQVKHEFNEEDIDDILDGRLGGLDKPTRIIDVMTGKQLR